MNYFPQLSTGTVAQYPLRKTTRFRTVVNESPGGSLFRYSDPTDMQTSWKLVYRGLTDSERDALTDLFYTVEGRLHPFTFVDPTGNMLLWSEKLTENVWAGSPHMNVQVGHTDPLGTERASRITNTAQIAQTIAQEVAAPGWFSYAASVQVRADVPCEAMLRIETNDGQIESRVAVSAEWRTLSCCSKLQTTAELIRAVLSLSAGGVVDAFGFQLQAQPSSSGYRATTDLGAVYADTFFAHDELEIVATDLNGSDCEVTLVNFSRGM